LLSLFHTGQSLAQLVKVILNAAICFAEHELLNYLSADMGCAEQWGSSPCHSISTHTCHSGPSLGGVSCSCLEAQIPNLQSRWLCCCLPLLGSHSVNFWPTQDSRPLFSTMPTHPSRTPASSWSTADAASECEWHKE
jgi:hypothetical protein